VRRHPRRDPNLGTGVPHVVGILARIAQRFHPSEAPTRNMRSADVVHQRCTLRLMQPFVRAVRVIANLIQLIAQTRKTLAQTNKLLLRLVLLVSWDT
jgi:hypothetical protein